MQTVGVVRTLEVAFDFEYCFSIHCVKGHRDSMELQRFKEAASKIKERSADIEVSMKDFVNGDYFLTVTSHVTVHMFNFNMF